MTQTIVRNIICIDTDLCTGCGQCVLDCAEGAIAIVDGKAKVISESYCDGLGACLAGCPTGALTIEVREAVPFDEEAAMAHVAANMPEKLGMPHQHALQGHGHAHGAQAHKPHHGGCPGAALREFQMAPAPAKEPTLPCGCPGSAVRELSAPAARTPGMKPLGAPMGAPLAQSAFIRKTWPVKLRLLPPTAPFLQGADILLTADCAPTASPHYHELLGTKLPIIACPKFEDNGEVLERLRNIFTVARPASVTVIRMEVPCCRGLASLAVQAAIGTGLEIREIVLGCNGEVVSDELMHTQQIQAFGAPSMAQLVNS